MIAAWVVFSLLLMLSATSLSRMRKAKQGQTEATLPAPASEPRTVTALAAVGTQPAISTQGVATATAVLESGMKDPTTYMARVAAPSGSLLDRLTYNRPGIWGNKAFYVGLAVVYIVLLALLFRILFQMARQSD